MSILADTASAVCSLKHPARNSVPSSKAVIPGFPASFDDRGPVPLRNAFSPLDSCRRLLDNNWGPIDRLWIYFDSSNSEGPLRVTTGLVINVDHERFTGRGMQGR